MEKERYDELFSDEKRWILQARRLKIAGDTLTTPTKAALQAFLGDQAGKLQQSPEYLNRAELFRALSDARALLYGLAIENAAKARQISNRQISSQGGVPKGLRSDHNVLELVKQAGCTPSEEEVEFLELISYQVRTLARYPIAKNVQTQNQFTGRAVGGTPQDSNTVQRIILNILKDEHLQKLFETGYG